MTTTEKLRGVWFPALASGALLAASFPPWNLSLLAWIAPIGWLHLIRKTELPSNRPYWIIVVAASLHWLAVMQGVRLAHWILHFGWLALSIYLACYVAGFVAISRIAVHRLKLPLWITAPIVWTGLELLRGKLLTGFSMALLGHTQSSLTVLIQIADLFGAYGVSFVVMLVAACLASCLPTVDSDSDRRWNWKPLLPAVIALAGVLGYGRTQISNSAANEGNSSSSKKTLKLALLQQPFDTIFEHNPDRNAAMFESYRKMSLDAARQHADLDLIVWPESMFSANSPEFSYDESKLPADYLDQVRAMTLRFANKAATVAQEINSVSVDEKTSASPRDIHLVVGCDSVHFAAATPQVRNSVLLIDPTGKVIERYAKIHLVMFGEYIPFADIFPWLYQVSPMKMGVTRGDGPRAMQVREVHLSPSVCFESTVPHLIRKHVAQLQAAGHAPDLLVNVTNDGWFWGSAILDLHLNCAIFRAVENRRPLVVAANTGITAAISSTGKVIQQLPRRTEGMIVVSPSLDDRVSGYQRIGDSFAWLCLLCCVGVVALGRRRSETVVPERNSQ